MVKGRTSSRAATFSLQSKAYSPQSEPEGIARKTTRMLSDRPGSGIVVIMTQKGRGPLGNIFITS